MKSERRHELATNELADWITHLPQWAKENMTTVIVGAVLVVGLIGYTIFFYSMQGKASQQKGAQATSAMEMLNYQKRTVLQGQAEGLGASDVFINTSGSLKTIADESENPKLAALVMVKRAEALRTELHYRSKPAEKDVQKYQLDQAKKIYEDALAKAADFPSIAAMAEYGIALCAEETGDFAVAKSLYEKIAAEPKYQGNTIQLRAEMRAKILADFKGDFTFAKVEVPETAQPEPDLSLDAPLDIEQLAPDETLDVNLLK